MMRRANQANNDQALSQFHTHLANKEEKEFLASLETLGPDVVFADNERPLQKVAKAGDVKALLYLLNEGVSLHFEILHGHSPLYLAIKHKHYLIQQILFIAAADKAACIKDAEKNQEDEIQEALEEMTIDLDVLKGMLAWGILNKRKNYKNTVYFQPIIPQVKALLSTQQKASTQDELSIALLSRIENQSAEIKSILHGMIEFAAERNHVGALQALLAMNQNSYSPTPTSLCIGYWASVRNINYSTYGINRSTHPLLTLKQLFQAKQTTAYAKKHALLSKQDQEAFKTYLLQADEPSELKPEHQIIYETAKLGDALALNIHGEATNIHDNFVVLKYSLEKHNYVAAYASLSYIQKLSSLNLEKYLTSYQNTVAMRESLVLAMFFQHQFEIDVLLENPKIIENIDHLLSSTFSRDSIIYQIIDQRLSNSDNSLIRVHRTAVLFDELRRKQWISEQALLQCFLQFANRSTEEKSHEESLGALATVKKQILLNLAKELGVTITTPLILTSNSTFESIPVDLIKLIHTYVNSKSLAKLLSTSHYMRNFSMDNRIMPINQLRKTILDSIQSMSFFTTKHGNKNPFWFYCLSFIMIISFVADVVCIVLAPIYTQKQKDLESQLDTTLYSDTSTCNQALSHLKTTCFGVQFSKIFIGVCQKLCQDIISMDDKKQGTIIGIIFPAIVLLITSLCFYGRYKFQIKSLFGDKTYFFNLPKSQLPNNLIAKIQAFLNQVDPQFPFHADVSAQDILTHIDGLEVKVKNKNENWMGLFATKKIRLPMMPAINDAKLNNRDEHKVEILDDEKTSDYSKNIITERSGLLGK